MQQVVLEKPGQLIKRSVEPPTPAAGQALVRVRRIGICGTDIHAFHGRQNYFTYPRVLGHELGVEVLEVADNERKIRPGDHCSVDPFMTCGQCWPCAKGKSNCCEKMNLIGVHSDGGMCETIVVPVHHLYPSSKASLDHLALVEPLGIGAHAVERAAPEPDDKVLIIGVGPIGLAVHQFVHLAGLKPTVLDVSQKRLNFCQAHLPVQQAATELNDNLRFTVVFDVTGNRHSMQAAFSRVAHGGKLIFVGHIADDICFSDPELHKREMTVLASRNTTPNQFARIINLIETNQINIDPWITDRITLTDLPEVFQTVCDPSRGGVKTLVVVE
jgi:2-desacetyl-2-hydroxyethyl bacteriochlorophyllide A dehydrogenase